MVTSLVLTEENQLISGSFDGEIETWDLKTGDCLNILQGHTGTVYSLVLTEEGQLISGSSDRTIKVWDLKTGDCLKTLQGHSRVVTALVLSKEGQLISGSFDKMIKIWDLKTSQCLHTLQGHEEVKFLILTKEQQLISASLDGTIKFWDLKTLQCLHTLQGHPDRVMPSLILTKKWQLISDSSTGTINILDFAASNKAIFQELVETIKEVNFDHWKSRFLRMPQKERAAIYEEFDKILNLSLNNCPFSSEVVFFHVNVGGSWSYDQYIQPKVQAITNYLKKLPDVPVVANTAISVEKPIEELNEVFQYFTDILQITQNQKKVFFPMSEFSEAFVEHTGLVNTACLQAIGINPKLIENLAQLQGQLKQLSHEGKQEQADQHHALKTITPVKDSIGSLLVNLLPLIELGQDVVTVPLDSLMLMQSSLIKRKALLEQTMGSPQTCNQFVDSGDLFEFACSLLADITPFEQCIKHSQIELLEAYLSQPFLNTTWENLQANRITRATQLAQQLKTPSEFYRL